MLWGRERELTSETKKMDDATANRIGMTSRAGGYISSISGSGVPLDAVIADSAVFSESLPPLFELERVSRVSAIV